MAFACFAQSAQAQLQQLAGHVPDIVKNGLAPLVSILPAGQKMHLSIVLPLRNKPVFDQLLKELYDPKSPRYRQFLAPEQFAQQFSPAQSDYQKVIDFARANGFTVTNTPPNRMILSMEGTAAQVEQAFHVHMNVYRNRQEKRNFYAPDREPSISLSVPIYHISGLTNIAAPHPMLQTGNGNSPFSNATGSGPGGSYIASDMRVAYYGGSTLIGHNQCVALAEFAGYNIEDVVQTLQGSGKAQASYATNGGNYTYTPPGTNTPYTIQINNVPIAGGSATPNPNDPGGVTEVILDMAQAIAMAPGMSQLRVYLAPDSFTQASPNYSFPANASDTEMFNTIASDDTCKQISLSWNWTPENITYNDEVFEQFIAQGQNLFVASGDSGGWSGNIYTYPEEDQYSIAVGGTDLATTSSGAIQSQSAWSSSGGGISPHQEQLPPWQAGISNSCNSASSSYRNGPDVAMEANGDNYVCNASGSCPNIYGGTSFAAPRWASYLALVNQQATASGKAPSGGSIGFIAKELYTIGASSSYQNNMFDITSGDNGTYNTCPGYDLVTGWGTPKGQNTIKAFVSSAGNGPMQAAAPYEYNVNVTLQGSAPPTSITTTMTLGDATTGATIYYQTITCGDPSALAAVQPGTTLTFVNDCPSIQMSGTMYATAPNYTTSQTVGMSSV